MLPDRVEPAASEVAVVAAPVRGSDANPRG